MRYLAYDRLYLIMIKTPSDLFPSLLILLVSDYNAKLDDIAPRYFG